MAWELLPCLETSGRDDEATAAGGGAGACTGYELAATVAMVERV